ncbi:hypothetical protein HOLleu_05504 [Holothuria leucospilota]|uniref:Uncharacterized protein n=1 Tax=Holothuria leucospilota TaxID=206669 RepID=A0A9Q1CLR3_HOLLE|nr:hypothetical protein HOLleu_05504 [Holothuria leucospilota]
MPFLCCCWAYSYIVLYVVLLILRTDVVVLVPGVFHVADCSLFQYLLVLTSCIPVVYKKKTPNSESEMGKPLRVASFLDHCDPATQDVFFKIVIQLNCRTIFLCKNFHVHLL